MTRNDLIRPALLAALAAAACTSPQEPSLAVPRPVPFIVSNPVLVVPPNGAAPSAILSSDSLAFISLPPGTLPGATAVTVRVRRTGATASAALLNGGLDPLAIPALEGDTVTLTVTGGSGPKLYVAPVPPRKPPVIIRTDPERNKRDVALNARLQLIFSEPIAAASLAGATVELRAGNTTVSGQVGFGNAEHTVVTFTPDELLSPGTAYELVVQTGIRDLDGSALEAAARIPFTAAPAPASSGTDPWVVSNVVNGQVFVSVPSGALPVWMDFVSIEVKRTGLRVTPMIRDGGVDPVALPAVTGDSLILTGWGSPTVAVPSQRAPVLIRTNPADGATSVAVDERMHWVFSEPVDPVWFVDFGLASLGNAVPGQVAFANPEHTIVEFTPDANLAPGTPYELVLGPNVMDLDGMPLGPGPIVPIVPFTTAGTFTRELAFVRGDHIYLTGPAGILKLTDTGPGVSNKDPAWSPDGQRLAFASNRSGTWAIWTMNADGSSPVQLTHGTWDDEPAWSPDGKTIAFTSAVMGFPAMRAISVVDAAGGSSARVLLDRPGYEGMPAWSRDGLTVAFTTDLAFYDFKFDLYAVNADGSGLHPVLEGPTYGEDRFFFQGSWSPDGQKIAVVECPWAFEYCYPTSSIAVANADGSGLTVIARTGGYARPSWSPDGSLIAFGSTTCRTCASEIRYVNPFGAGAGVFVTDGHSPAWRP